MSYRPPTPKGLKPKDLIGIPWKIAFALQEEGWYLRSDIIWYKLIVNQNLCEIGQLSHMNICFYFQNLKNTTMTIRLLRKRLLLMVKCVIARSVWMINTDGFKGSSLRCFSYRTS